MICRDRAGAFADGARTGAPDAVHVADRWHLWRNLAEAVERTVVRHRSQLREPPPSPPQPRRETHFAELTSSGNQEGRFADRTRERHADVHRLLDHGHGLREISRRLGLSRTTVRRFANAVTAEELLAGRWAGLPSILDPHKPYLHQRVQDGCTRSSVLFTELRGRGDRGGVTIVRR